MTDDSIPANVRAFVARHIGTIIELEALLLFRAHPVRDWSVGEMAARLYATETETAAALQRLVDDGLAQGEGDKLRLGCQEAGSREMVDQLAKLHATHLIPLTRLIHAKHSRIREFADAFKFRKGR